MQTVQVRLLNDGDYGDAEDVKFPVVVKGCIRPSGTMCDVHHDELHRVGFVNMTDDVPWPFHIGLECEVVL